MCLVSLHQQPCAEQLCWALALYLEDILSAWPCRVQAQRAVVTAADPASRRSSRRDAHPSPSKLVLCLGFTEAPIWHLDC